MFTRTFWIGGKSGTHVMPALHGARHAPPLQVSPSPHAFWSQSVSRQSTNPSQSSSTPSEHCVSLAAAGMQTVPVDELVWCELDPPEFAPTSTS
jgi:hypothetical protein